MSRKSTAALKTLVECKSRLVLIPRLGRKTAKRSSQTVVDRLGAFPGKLRRTLILDNGTENAKHVEISEITGTRCFFAPRKCLGDKTLLEVAAVALAA